MVKSLCLSILLLVFISCSEETSPSNYNRNSVNHENKAKCYMLNWVEGIGYIAYHPDEERVLYMAKPYPDYDGYTIKSKDEESRISLNLLRQMKWEHMQTIRPGYLFVEGEFDEKNRIFHFSHWYVTTPYVRLKYSEKERKFEPYLEWKLYPDDFKNSVAVDYTSENLEKYLKPKYFKQLKRE